MKAFQEMLRKITSSPYHDKMLRFAQPLKDYFGINHFWYYRVTDSGYYSYIGTHSDWNEYAFENQLIDHFPCLRHPDTLQNGISLMKNSVNTEYKKVLNTAWEKFQINFNINLLKKTAEGVEAFGFATQNNHPLSDEKLLNELPLLNHFISVFREKHQNLFQLLDDNQVDLSSHLGPLFKDNPRLVLSASERAAFLKKMGFQPFFSLTMREKDILRFVVHGYPASYIAEQLRLRKRTVENYIATVKCKFACNTKVELIQKTQELASIGYLQ